VCFKLQIIHTAGSRLRTVPLDIISDIQVIAHARVPIVKGRVILSDPHSPRAGVDFDMCVNNVLALHNTDLLRTYAQLDERCVACRR
jgi:DNA polymerase sigma